MEELYIMGTIALAPFYVLGVIAAAYATGFMIHSLSTMGQSAVQTKLTETIPSTFNPPNYSAPQ